MQTWKNVQPGDIFWDSGGGVIGWIIRLFTQSPYAHCGVFIEHLGAGIWRTHEAYPFKLKTKTRDIATVGRITRVWQNDEQQKMIINTSQSLVGTRYSFLELLRIATYTFKRRLAVWCFILAILTLTLIFTNSAAVLVPLFLVGLFVVLGFLYFPLTKITDLSSMICSNHVASCVMIARGDITFSLPSYMIWPGLLASELNLFIWNDYYSDENGS